MPVNNFLVLYKAATSNANDQLLMMLEVLIAMVLGSLISLSLFDLFGVVNRLSMQETSLLKVQDRIRFVNFFMRRKIHMAGNWSCAKTQSSKNNSIEKLTPERAWSQFLIHARTTSDVLLLRECVRIDHQLQYAPILFYIAKSAGSDNLYYQIDHHPREILADGVRKFNVSLKSAFYDVELRYQLKSQLPVSFGNKKLFVVGGMVDASSRIDNYKMVGVKYFVPALKRV